MKKPIRWMIILLDPVGGWGGGSENLFGACGQQR